MIHSTAPVFENLNASNWCRVVYCPLQLFSLRVVLGVGPGHCSGSVSCVSCINMVMLAGRGSHLSCFSFTIFFFSQSLFYFIYVWLCWVFVAAWAFSLFGSAWGLLSHCGVQVSHCGLVLLWRLGIMVPRQRGSSHTADGTHVSCVGR